jgi:hypothetical protein
LFPTVGHNRIGAKIKKKLFQNLSNMYGSDD